MTDPLTTLRAEVERLRDQAAQTHKKASQAVSMYWHRQNYDSWAASQTLSNQYHAATNHALASAYTIVLDLIDKQREGQ